MLFKHFINDFHLLSPAGRVLVINGFTFNLGFYMLLPYLADHLEQDIGLTGWYVGAIIGLRVLSQQGLFLVGGTLGDRFGYKRLILMGCAVRILGFALLGLGQSLPALLLGAFCSGFAGALFTPSSQAYLASEYPHQNQRQKVFALQNLTSEAGMLLGPLLGLALLSLDFSLVGILSASLFSVLLIIQWRYLPELESQQKTAKNRPVFWQQWGSMLTHKAFMLFVLCSSVYHLLFHQLYIATPHEVRVVTQDVTIITWVFATSSITGVLMQMPVSRFVAKHLGTATGMGLGMTIMGASYLWLNLTISAVPALPFIICALFFSLGSMLVFPLLGAHVPTFCQAKELGSHYGLYSCIGGIYAFIGNISTGWLLSSTNLSHSWVWFGLASFGMLSGLLLFLQVTSHLKNQNTALED
ncbi:MFS transporter [Marinomonas rhizomae]|uniref:Nitrate/nitrite transporter NarK n=1 Tax=Marinomonas rhizomae TaxID=491948 RepID=A0A366JIV5_9GAMM|nr:MFS transporter [Marinomonas rhizomae]RBP85758.1 nitrate/nitrite transporter NarK [Marinomonas rhizomae]RNF75621.1 MFS transporter [Marinomonas rhizomae]